MAIAGITSKVSCLAIVHRYSALQFFQCVTNIVENLAPGCRGDALPRNQDYIGRHAAAGEHQACRRPQTPPCAITGGGIADFLARRESVPDHMFGRGGVLNNNMSRHPFPFRRGYT